MLCFSPALSYIFWLPLMLLLSILTRVWKYWGITSDSHLDYNFITWFGVCKINHAALKNLSKNYFICVLYFNNLDILLLGFPNFFPPSVFQRIMKWCLHLNGNFSVQPCIIAEKVFLACTQQEPDNNSKYGSFHSIIRPSPKFRTQLGQILQWQLS